MTAPNLQIAPARDGGEPSRARLPLGLTPAQARALAYAGALALLASVLTPPTLAVGNGGVTPPLTIPWWVLAIGFLLTESFAVHTTFRRETWSFSLSEIPLIIGIAFASPGAVLLARLVGSGLTLTLHRRQRPVKLAFNLVHFWLETCVAILLFRLLVGQAPAVEPMGWVAAFGAMLGVMLVGGLAVTAAIALYQWRLELRMVRTFLVSGTIGTAVNTSVGIVAVTSLWHDLRSLWLLLIIAGLTAVSYGGYAALRDKHEGQQLLHSFTQAVARCNDFDSVLSTVLRQSCTVLRAEEAEVRIVLPDADTALLMRIDRDGTLTLARSGDHSDPVLDRVAAERRAALLPQRTRDSAVRGFLSRRGWRVAMAAPLEGEAGIHGTLVVADRLGDVATFGRAELQLFATLANHAAMALEKGRLVDRLRLEAAEKEHQALHDALTGLANRTLFNRRVQQAIAGVQRSERSVAVMLMDLDRFKEINDTLGHHVGDLLLAQVAKRLQGAMRGVGTISRLGGDEFAVCLPRTTGAEEAQAEAARLHASLARPITLEDMTLDVGVSIGIALSPVHGDDALTLLQRADVAMYAAKEDRSGVRVYDPDEDEYSPERLSLVGDLRRAIEDGELAVAYQPKADLRTGMVIGVEALVRWHHPKRGFIPPDEFIPIAEHTGLIQPLTRYVLRAALRQRRAWQQAGLTLDVAVNLSTRSLVDADLPAEVAALLDEEQVPAPALTLEITESTLMADFGRAADVLRELSARGVRLAIDDFGTGYSSLAYLKGLPVDELKIDRSFVMNMADDENDAVIVRTIIDLGRNLGLSLVAEGVEDEQAWTVLRALGCDIAQGYLLTPPLTAARLETWLVGWEASHGPGRPRPLASGAAATSISVTMVGPGSSSRA